MNDNNVNPFGEQPTKSESTPMPSQSAGDSAQVNPFGTPIPPTPDGNATGGNNTKKPVNAKLIGGIVAGVLVLAAVITTVAIVFAMSKVTAKDYDEAMDKLIEVTDSISDVDSEADIYNLGNMTEAEIVEAVDTVNSMMNEAQAKVDELGDMKAIAKDDEAKKLYEDFLAKFGDFKAATDNVMNSVKLLAPVLVTMKSADDIAYDDYAGMKAVFQKVADEARAIKTDNSNLRSALDNIASAADAFTTYYEQLESGDISSLDFDSIYDASEKLNDASDALEEAMDTDNITSISDEVSDSYEALGDYLYDQYYELI